jgi:hypothetical protein
MGAFQPNSSFLRQRRGLQVRRDVPFAGGTRCRRASRPRRRGPRIAVAIFLVVVARGGALESSRAGRAGRGQGKWVLRDPLRRARRRIEHGRWTLTRAPISQRSRRAVG